MYKFNYVLTDNDYFEFNRYHMENAPQMKKQITGLRLIAPAMLIIMIILSVLNRDETEDITAFIIGSSFVFVFISIVWFFAAKLLLMFSLKAQIKLMKKDGKLPYGKNVSIEFDETFFIESTEINETKTKYASIEKIAVSNNMIYVYFSAIQAFILPLSVFESNEQKDAFLLFINDKKEESKNQII